MPSDSGSLLNDTLGGNRNSPWEGDGFAVVVLERRGRAVRADGRQCGLPLRRAMVGPFHLVYFLATPAYHTTPTHARVQPHKGTSARLR